MAPPPPPPVCGPWQWLRCDAAPHDQLVLAVGVAAALASGMYITQVGVVVSAALGAFATTPVDAAALSTAVHDLQWLAFALLLAETLASMACTRVAAQFTNACGEARRQRQEAPDGEAGEAAHAETRIQRMEEAIRYNGAPALLGFIRGVALLGTLLALVCARCDDMVDVLNVVVPMTVFGVLVTGLPPTMAIPNPTPGINHLFAKFDLTELRAIAAHNAQDVAGAAHQERAQTSGDNDAAQTLIWCVPSGLSPGAAWVIVSQIIVLWARAATHDSAVSPHEAFEAASGTVLTPVALVLVLRHYRTMQWAMDVLHKMTATATATATDTNTATPATPGRAGTRPGEATTWRTVCDLLEPDRRLLFVGGLGAAAGGVAIAHAAALTASTVVAIVAQLATCTANTMATDHRQACRAELHAALTSRPPFFLFQGAAVICGCVFLSFWSFRFLGAKLYRRVLSLHVDAACHQSVCRFESPGNGADAFDTAYVSLPIDASFVCRTPGVLLVSLSTTLAALATFFASWNGASTRAMLLVAIGNLAIGWTYRKRRRVASVLDALQGPLVGCAAFAKAMLPTIAFSYGSHLVEHGASPALGELVTPLVALSLAVIAATVGGSHVDAFVEDWQRAVHACAVITERRAHATKLTATTDSRIKVSGECEFRNVSFHDPMHKNASALKQLSLTIHAGQTVVFCGPPGGGHEHIVALLEKFYNPTSGDVLMDGANLKDVDTVWLRDQIGLVEAKPMLFEGTVSENIAVGCGRCASQEQIEVAAKLANAHDSIVEDLAAAYTSKVSPAETYHDLFGIRIRLPFADHRMMAVLKKDGSATDTDQHHRIALARVFLKDPSILILNEPTKDLVVASLKVVRQGVAMLLASNQKRTTIVIGHELPTVRVADHIYVLNDGEIAEQGPHAQLIAKDGGLYRSLVEGTTERAG